MDELPINPLTYLHLRFEVEAQQAIKLGGHQAGERLRDALASVMLRAVCPEARREQRPTAEHAAQCPACWLLAYEAEHGAAASGMVRRAYALAPPYPPLDVVQPGESFAFSLTLFGSGFDYLPYFVLAVPEMGRGGVGPGRGRFELRAIQAIDPLSGRSQTVLAPGEKVVRPPERPAGWEAAETSSQRLLAQLNAHKSLEVRFLSPTRLVHDGALAKAPDFGIFFRRLLERSDQLAQQYAGQERRPAESVEQLYRLADQVRLIESQVEWVDLWAPSGRTGQRTPLGGFVGRAVYRGADWKALLPWLVLGQAVQVGKLTAKGNGVYEIRCGEYGGYWSEGVLSQTLHVTNGT
jgi:hypothetical protein